MYRTSLTQMSSSGSTIVCPTREASGEDWYQIPEIKGLQNQNSRKSANTKLKTFTSIHKGGHPRRAQSALASMECDCKNTTNYLQVKNQEEKMNRSVPGRRDRCSLHTSVHRSSDTNPAQESVQSRPRPTVKVSVHLDAKRCIL